jgi:glycerol-3-phosphate cytidylyltransferase-like family protein
MTTVVIMPGGFHPFHPGHLALYQSAQRTFPDAEVYVAATKDTTDRPFEFSDKQKIAYAAGVEPGHFVLVKSPFQAMEIASKYDPDRDQIIFVRSEKDANSPPKPGGVKKDGSPSYLQPLSGAKRLEPFRKHAYMAYLPTVEFGPGAFTSATQIRTTWPKLTPKRKLALIMSLYPSTQQDPAGAQDIVRIFDKTIGTEVAENQGWAATYEADGLTAGTGVTGGMHASYQDRYNQPTMEDYVEEARVDPIEAAAVDFYQNQVGDVNKKPVNNYKEISRELLGKTENPSMRKKIMDILVQGNKNPYIQGGVITTVGALLAGGILSSAARAGLSPQQTNILLQAVLNTVIPTMVSRVNGRSWRDTIKYTLASAGIGTGIAAMTETGRKK